MLPGVAARFDVNPRKAYIGGAEKREPVGDAPLRHRRSKEVRLGDEPVGHEAAVGAAREVHRSALVGVVGEGVARDAHHVVRVDRAEPPRDAVREPVAVARAPARVAVDDRVALCG